MRRTFFVSALLSLSLFVAVGFGQSAPAWQKVTSADGKFEVSFPFKHETTQNAFGVGANRTTMTLLTAEAPEGAFLVTYTDVSTDIPDPSEALLRAQKGSVGAVDGTLISSSASTFMGYPSREFKVKVNPIGDLVMVATVKAVIVGRRLYQIAVVTSESNLEEQPMFTQFLSSFRLSAPSAVAKN